MKKVYPVLLAVGMNMFMASCTQGDVVEDENLFHTVATEGDDGDPPMTPPPEGD